MSHSENLPISPLLPQLVAHLSKHTRLVLEAPPGAGKTTQVPLALLKAEFVRGKIIMLEPRRLAARAAASYMAQLLGEAVGQTVGYRVRLENKVSAQTRIEVVTEGILTRMLQSDPALEGVSVVIFDEFHERNLQGDLGLALCIDSQNSLREDLRIVLMSATLDGDRLAQFLQCERITSAGKSFPVEVSYLAANPNEQSLALWRRALLKAIAESDGDVLMFLPGKGEIERAKILLAQADLPANFSVLELHGELDIRAQQAVLQLGAVGERRIVLATNVAESSVTLPGIRAVVDTGLAREPKFDPSSGLSRLETVNISQASATQRAGRAGRVAAGLCYRLWPQSQRLEASTRAEILSADLASLALELAAWGSNDLPWLDAPPAAHFAQAQDLLRDLDALDSDNRITAQGHQLQAFGAHPRLANALLRADKNFRGVACDLVALIEGRDVLRGEARRNDDIVPRLRAMELWRAEKRASMDADRAGLAFVSQLADSWRQRLQCTQFKRLDDEFVVGQILSFAFPDRIARQIESSPLRYQFANGRGARLHENSSLRGQAWLVVSDARFESNDSLIQRAAAVDEDFLRQHFAHRFGNEVVTAFDNERGAVTAHEVSKFAQIELSRRVLAVPRNAQTNRQLIAAISQLGVDALPWTENLRQWQLRVQCLREWVSELNLPDVSDAALRNSLSDWLQPYISEAIKLSEISAAQLGQALHALLDYAQQQALDENAPVAINVPSGNQKRLQYQVGQAPVLAVKLQEMFGLADTPCVGKGRVPVTLHLLSPAQRPLQVTQDLRGFWQRTYPEVKKQMKGDYPRHPWPDDPWTATPTAKAKPRQRR